MNMKNQTITKTQEMQNPSGAKMEKRLYTVHEAARYLGRFAWAVREMYYHGKIPAVRDGRRMLFDIADLDAWIKKIKFTWSIE